MSETSNLISTLKQLLKEKKVNQADVAAVLGLGVARVKQMFASNDFQLKRVVKICNELLGMELADLVLIMEERHSYIQSLTEEQEKQLTSDNKLLVVAVSVMTNWTPKQISCRYQISERECNCHLRTLEKLKLIRIRDNGRVKMLINHNFTWIQNGPLEQYFTRHIQSDFLNASFHDDGEVRLFRTGMLSKKSVDELTRQIDKTVTRFVELNRDDLDLPLKHRTGYSMVVAFRPWVMPAFTKLLRTS